MRVITFEYIGQIGLFQKQAQGLQNSIAGSLKATLVRNGEGYVISQFKEVTVEVVSENVAIETAVMTRAKAYGFNYVKSEVINISQSVV